MARILHLVTDSDLRGAQVFASDLVNALTDGNHDHQIVGLRPGQSGTGLDIDTLGPRRLSVSTLRRLSVLMQEADLTVAHGSTTLFAAALVARFTSARFVYRQISDQKFWVNTKRRYLRVRLALRAADHVVCLWTGAHDQLRDRFGVEPSRLTIIPNGVPKDRFQIEPPEQRHAARALLDLDPETPVVLGIGAQVPEKGFDLAVRAAGMTSDWQLLLLGSGPERDALKRLASSCGGQVAFHDPIRDPSVAYSAADIIVLPSRGGDSMPAVLIEAGLFGVPAVATPIEGIVDIVRPGKTGELVPVDDVNSLAIGIDRALDQRDSYGRAARELCESQFEIGVVARQWSDVLDRVLGEPSS